MILLYFRKVIPQYQNVSRLRFIYLYDNSLSCFLLHFRSYAHHFPDHKIFAITVTLKDNIALIPKCNCQLKNLFPSFTSNLGIL